MHKGRNYRRILPPIIAGNMLTPGHGSPVRLTASFSFPWSGGRIVLEPAQSTRLRVINASGFIEWGWNLTAGVYDFSLNFQQLLQPNAPELKWDLAIVDTFGGIGVWEWIGMIPQYSYTSTILGWPPSTTKFVNGFFYDGPVFMQTRPVTYHEET